MDRPLDPEDMTKPSLEVRGVVVWLESGVFQGILKIDSNVNVEERYSK